MQVNKYTQNTHTRARGHTHAHTHTRQLRLQGPVSVRAHCTEGVTGSEGREEANGVGGRIRVIGAGTDTGKRSVAGKEA